MFPRAGALFEKLPRYLRRHRLMKGWMRLTGESELQLVRIRDDSFGYADMSDGFLRLIVIDQDFEHDFFRIADVVLKPGATLFDIGANHGLLSFGLAAKFPDVSFHLFEPNPNLVDSIRKTYQLYPDMRLKLNEFALAQQPGKSYLQLVPGHNGASYLGDEKSGVEIEVRTLDVYAREAGIDRVELMKIDVEGFELPALQGAKAMLSGQQIQVIYFEYAEKWLRRVGEPSHLISFLEETGYEVCYCRESDLQNFGGATHRVAEGYAGSGLPVKPVAGTKLPESTDLLALPVGRLEEIA